MAGRADVVSFLELRSGDDEWNSTRRVSHQGTYNANPVASAAGVTALRLIESGEECQKADATTAALVGELNALFRRQSVPGTVSLGHGVGRSRAPARSGTGSSALAAAGAVQSWS